MRFLIVTFILFSLVGCPSAPPSSTSSRRELRGHRSGKGDSGRRRSERERDNRGDKGDTQAGGERGGAAAADEGALTGDFTFPVEVGGNGNIQLTVRMEENNTKAVIQSGGSHPLNLLAGFNGRFASDGARQVTLTGARWELVFHLETEISLTQPSGAEVRRGQVLGSTTGSVAFRLKENGAPVRFCLNVVNLSEGQIQVHQTGAGEDSCD